jgi:hypothetical protein
VPFRVKVTGKPVINKMVKAKNIQAGRYSIRKMKAKRCHSSFCVKIKLVLKT